jgi:hypothetical protein
VVPTLLLPLWALLALAAWLLLLLLLLLVVVVLLLSVQYMSSSVGRM